MEDTLTVRIATVTPDLLRVGSGPCLLSSPGRSLRPLMREAVIPLPPPNPPSTQHGDYTLLGHRSAPVRGVEAVGIDLQKADNRKMPSPFCRPRSPAEQHKYYGQRQPGRFRENLTSNVSCNPNSDEARPRPPAQRNWNRDFFPQRQTPSYWKSGCGRANVQFALAQRDPLRNYIGMDIKGARMWRGAKTATDRQDATLPAHTHRVHRRAVRRNEISEIWITPRSAAQNPAGQETPHFAALPGLLRPPALARRADQLKTDLEHPTPSPARSSRHTDWTCEVSEADIYGWIRRRSARSRRPTKPVFSRWDFDHLARFCAGRPARIPWFDWEEDDKAEKDNEAERQLSITRLSRHADRHRPAGIRLLTPEQLTLWLDDLPRLERRLSAVTGPNRLPAISDYRRNATHRDLADAASPQWHSFWFSSVKPTVRSSARRSSRSVLIRRLCRIGYGRRASERNE